MRVFLPFVDSQKLAKDETSRLYIIISLTEETKFWYFPFAKVYWLVIFSHKKGKILKYMNIELSSSQVVLCSCHISVLRDFSSLFRCIIFALLSLFLDFLLLCCYLFLDLFPMVCEPFLCFFDPPA